MAFELAKNLQVATVLTPPSPATSGTSLVVDSGLGARFDTPPFNAFVVPSNARPTKDNSEVVRVSNISTDTFTIARAQESSTARTIVAGDLIFVGPTAKTWTDIQTALDARQPLDSDLTAIAALTTTSYGRSVLALADAAAAQTLFSAQPSDSDLTAIAALSTTSFGRSLLTQADAAAALSTIGAQPSDADLTSIAALTTTSYGRSLLEAADAAALRTLASVYSIAQVDFAITSISSLPNAKGDMIGATGDNVMSRIPAGSDGAVPIFDSTATPGVRTGTPLGGLGGYTTVAAVEGGIPAGTSAGNLAFAGSGTPIATGSAMGSSMQIYIDDADYTITGLTTKMRVKMVLFTNATAPAINFTAGLSAITGVAGGANSVAYTYSAQTAGTTVTRTTPAASTRFVDLTADFNVPADGYYLLTVTTSGAMAATNPRVNVVLYLQVRHII